ncbi:MAG TPA: hypothetical protein VGV65_11310 [Nocardioides sp.]|nr:hypothetical protein [Nocardioides sp.]
MVNELRELMHEATDRPPRDHDDLSAVLSGGRRRVRLRRAVAVGGTALAAGAITLGSLAWLDPAPADLDAAGVPRPDGPSLRVAGAAPAVEGTDYRELASYANEDLDSDNGEYFDGVTDDGLVLFREGQTMARRLERYALMDPATGQKDWLPQRPGDGEQSWAVELGADRLVLMRFVAVDPDDGMRSQPVLDVFDRDARTWRTVSWPTLPTDDFPSFVRLGPDGRAYVALLADRGDVPDGGWPVGSDGEADDADAEGDVRALWSMSLTDPSDVRDEQLQVGDFAFDGGALVWTDSTNGAAGKVHVRDLATGDETSFDPEMGERCNLLGLDASGGRIAMSQYCGTYDGVRDDRVQVVTTDGEQVVTLQDDGIEAGDLVGGGDYLTLTSYDRSTQGTYLYDFDEGRLLRLSDSRSAFTVGQGPTPGDQLMWTTAAGGLSATFGRTGGEVHLGEIIR